MTLTESQRIILTVLKNAIGPMSIKDISSELDRDIAHIGASVKALLDRELIMEVNDEYVLVELKPTTGKNFRRDKVYRTPAGDLYPVRQIKPNRVACLCHTSAFANKIVDALNAFKKEK